MKYGVAAHFARVDFNRIFAAGYQLEMLAYHGKHALELLIAQKSGRAAAEMQLRQLVAAVEMRRQ